MTKKKKKKKKSGRWTTISIYPGTVIHLIGRKGGGKSMTAAKIAADNAVFFPGGIYDNPLMMYHGPGARAHISIKDLSYFRFSWSMIITDEAQIGGLFARSWGKNLKDYDDHENLLLAQISLARHYHNSMIIITHGRNELDSAIRDNNLIDVTYYCRPAFLIGHWWIVAEKMIQSDWTDEHGNRHTDARFPTLKEKIFKKGAIVFIRKSKYGSLYESEATDDRIDALPAYTPERAAELRAAAAAPRKRGRPSKKNPE